MNNTKDEAMPSGAPESASKGGRRRKRARTGSKSSVATPAKAYSDMTWEERKAYEDRLAEDAEPEPARAPFRKKRGKRGFPLMRPQAPANHNAYLVASAERTLEPTPAVSDNDDSDNEGSIEVDGVVLEMSFSDFDKLLAEGDVTAEQGPVVAADSAPPSHANNDEAHAVGAAASTPAPTNTDAATVSVASPSGRPSRRKKASRDTYGFSQLFASAMYTDLNKNELVETLRRRDEELDSLREEIRVLRERLDGKPS